jgi:glyoxylase-like metal-dependent hydrolase (beta-lactamase superfamily II)
LKADEHIKELLVTYARNNLLPIRGQIDLIDDETEIVPGIRAVAAPGHTPGHLALNISSGGQRLLVVSDAVIHPVHMEQPDWYAAVDLDSERAVDTRRRLLDIAANEKALVFAFHFPFPGLGRVAHKGDGWQWQPIETTD